MVYVLGKNFSYFPWNEAISSRHMINFLTGRLLHPHRMLNFGVALTGTPLRLPTVKLIPRSYTELFWVFWGKWLRDNGPLARYVKLRVAHATGMPGTVSLPLRIRDPDMHHGTCVTHVPWCMPWSLTRGFLWSRWRGKRSRHSRRMRKPQFYVSGKRPIRVHFTKIYHSVPHRALIPNPDNPPYDPQRPYVPPTTVSQSVSHPPHPHSHPHPLCLKPPGPPVWEDGSRIEWRGDGDAGKVSQCVPARPDEHFVFPGELGAYAYQQNCFVPAENM